MDRSVFFAKVVVGCARVGKVLILSRVGKVLILCPLFHAFEEHRTCNSCLHYTLTRSKWLGAAFYQGRGTSRPDALPKIAL